MINTCTGGEGKIGNFCCKDKTKAYLYYSSGNGALKGKQPQALPRGVTHLRECSEYVDKSVSSGQQQHYVHLCASTVSKATLLTHKELNKCFLVSTVLLDHPYGTVNQVS